jgi:hypothetical protein
MWPWLAVAGAGALHGLNPASGWAVAAAWAVRSREASMPLRALLPMALGHVVAIALVAAAAALGVPLQMRALQHPLLALLAGLVLAALGCCFAHRLSSRAGQAGLALLSFAMSTANGAGMMLVPALMPLCLADAPAREITASGSLAPALAAVFLHTAAMLLTTGLITTAACRVRTAATIARIAGTRRELTELAWHRKPSCWSALASRWCSAACTSPTPSPAPGSCPATPRCSPRWSRRT